MPIRTEFLQDLVGRACLAVRVIACFIPARVKFNTRTA